MLHTICGQTWSVIHDVMSKYKFVYRLPHHLAELYSCDVRAVLDKIRTIISFPWCIINEDHTLWIITIANSASAANLTPSVTPCMLDRSISYRPRNMHVYNTCLSDGCKFPEWEPLLVHRLAHAAQRDTWVSSFVPKEGIQTTSFFVASW